MKISRKSITLWRIRLYIAAVVCALATSLFLKPLSIRWCILTAVWVAIFLVAYFFYCPKRYKNTVFGINADGRFYIKGGVFYRSEWYMEVEKVQYVSFAAGPISRALGLKSAIILAPGSRLYLPALDRETQEKLLKALGR